jgi:cell division protein ZapA
MSQTPAVEMSISLLDKTYLIKCPPSEQDALQKAAHYFDQAMRETRSAGVVGLDRTAIITGLNIVCDMLDAKNQRDSYVHQVSRRIHDLHQHIDKALIQSEQLEL